MEHNTLQRRSAGTIKNMGVNSYSQIVSAFRAQGDLTDDQLTIFPILQNALGVSRERHTAEIKRAIYDDQLSEIASSINSSTNTTKWETEANYACPNIVHHPPSTKYIQIAEQVLQTTPPTTTIQYPPAKTTTKLNRDLQKLVHDEVKHDGIINATQQQPINTPKLNFNTTDIQSSKVVRLVRAQQAPKRKTSLDTLIEVVQKELLRVNGQTNSISPSSSPPYMRSLPSFRLQNRISQSISSPHRSTFSSVLPLSQTNHSFKLARKRGFINLNSSRKVSPFQQRNRSFNNHDDDYIDNNEFDQSTEDIPSGPENIEEIVRETVDRLVAITLLNNAPYIVNMLTAVPGNGNNINTDSQIVTNSTPMIKYQPINSKIDHYRSDSAYLTSTGNDLRTSPLKQQQQIHHPQLIIQPATTNSIPTIQGTTTPTLFVAPRILNFQTVVPKPTTNIQIGNTKIILVSPSNINKHLPHSTTVPQQANLGNNSSVKLVKFTTTNNNNINSLPTRTTTLPTQTSTLTLPKNVQIVIPSQTPSTIQLTRTHSDDTSKSLPITTTATATNTFRPITTVTVDHIPQAAQEVTISTSPTSSPPLQTNTSDLQQQSTLGTTVNVISSNTNNQSTNDGNSQQRYSHGKTSENNNNTDNNISTRGNSRRRSSSSTPIDKPVGKVLRPITKTLPATIADNTSPVPIIQQQQSVTRTSPSQDEMIKSVSVNFQQQPPQIQRSPSTHGPMIYRMTSVNPNVPVFRVRATTAPTSSTVMNKSIKTDAKPISVTTTTNMCYEPKPTHTTPTPSGSVSVLACFKTTKKRNKERAIMPRPSTNDLNDSSIANTPSSTANTSLIVNSDIINSNTSPDYQRQSSSTPTHFVQQTSLSSTLSDDNISNAFLSSMPEQVNDTTTSSSNSIPISRDNHQFNSIETITTTPPNLSPIQSLNSISRPTMEDKSIQCINEENDEEENSIEEDQVETSKEIHLETKKRSGDEENWTTEAECLLRDVLSQSSFHSLDPTCQETLSSKFELLQSNLLDGTFLSKDDFHQSMLDLKQKLLSDGLSPNSEENLDKIFNYFETEFSQLSDERKRIRRQ